MASLQLLENGRLVVDDGFLATVPPNQIEGARISEIECRANVDVDAVLERFRDTANSDVQDRASTDGVLAAHIHKCIPVTRRLGAVPELWHYLAVVGCPEYVYWRWFSPQIGKVRITRYLGPWYLNAFGRLWWWAELSYADTGSEPDYGPTICGAASQEFMRDMIENLLCGNRRLVNTLIAQCFNTQDRLSDAEIREVVKRLNMMLVTTSLDALSDLSAIVASVVAEVRVEKAVIGRASGRRRGLRGLFRRH